MAGPVPSRPCPCPPSSVLAGLKAPIKLQRCRWLPALTEPKWGGGWSVVSVAPEGKVVLSLMCPDLQKGTGAEASTAGGGGSRREKVNRTPCPHAAFVL